MRPLSTRSLRRWLAALTLVGLSTAATASASVVEHAVTPSSDASLPGVDVQVTRRGDGSLVLRLTAQPAPVAVYAPQLVVPGTAPTRLAWRNGANDTVVADVVIPAAHRRTFVITVMRDFGLVGHRYVVRGQDWGVGR